MQSMPEMAQWRYQGTHHLAEHIVLQYGISLVSL